MRLNWKPPKVFYGWWIVGASGLIGLYTLGIVQYGFTAVFEPIANEFGWSYTQISFGVSIRGLGAGLLAPLIGMFVDRLGARRLIFGGTFITCLGLLLLSRITSLSMFYVSFVLITLGMTTCAPPVLNTAVANWFQKKVGIAMAIASSAIGAGGLLVPLIVILVDTYEWRTAMSLLALGIPAIVLPSSLLLRHKPEQYGYLPDGEVKDAVIAGKESVTAKPAEVEIGVKQALKSRAFWHIAFQPTVGFMMVVAMTTHIMPYLSSIGVARSTSGLVVSAMSLLGIAGYFCVGWLGDKFDKRWVWAVALTLRPLGLLCFVYVAERSWLLVPLVLLYGLGWGGGAVMLGIVTREYFGRSHFGAIMGLIAGMMGLGSVAGPPLAGWAFDTLGSYQTIWLAFAAVALTTAIIVAAMPPPPTKTRMIDKT